MPSSPPEGADARPAGTGDGPVHVADLLTRAAGAHPEQEAVVDVAGGTSLTWAEFDAAVTAEAGRLRRAGVRPGDRVVVALPDDARFCVALFGALRADAVAVPVGPESVRRELDIIFSQAGPAVVVAEDAEPTVVEAADAAGARLLPPPRTDADQEGADVGTRGTEESGTEAPDTGEPGTGEPGIGESGTGEWGGEALAVLVFTSGTTGRPRGVKLSHRALLANRRQAAALRPAPVTPVDRVLLALPLYHVYGLAAGLFQVCWAGATVVLPGRFDPARTAEVLVSSRVSVLAGVPSMFRALLDVPAPQLREALGGVRLCTSGGAPLPAAWLAEFREATGLALHEGYGLTEGGPVITSNDLGRPPKPGSVGRVLPGIEMRLVDANGHPLAAAEAAADPEDPVDDGSDPTDDTGLISLRGPNLFSGYWPDGSGGPDAEGWFRTADVGYLDADGDLHLVDRSSDLVIVNGFNVFPREVEQVIGELDAVAEVAVVGIPDDRTGAAVKAVVVAAPGSGLTEEQVHEHCAARLARFKRPTVVTFADELPRTPTGKIARRTLARM